jgi:Ca2+/Na+ antiporter
MLFELILKSESTDHNVDIISGSCFFILFVVIALGGILVLRYTRNNADKEHYPDRELDRKALKIVPHDLLRE